jgi:hypothetical protein
MSNEAIVAAQQIIGSRQDGDDQIRPSNHHELFESTAPAFVVILKSSEVEVAATDYEAADEVANTAKNEFERVFKLSNVMVLLTSIIIVFVLATAVVNPTLKTAFIGFGLLSLVGGAFSFYYLNQLREGKLLSAWMSAREASEAARLQYFLTVTNADSETVDNAMRLIKLEYFRRFQLDSQRTYYTKAGDKHANKARKALKWSSVAAGGAGVVTALAGFLGFTNPKFAAVATLGTLFAALSTYVKSGEDVFNNKRNAERYAQTGKALNKLYASMDKVRKAVQNDGQQPLLDFVSVVHQQLLTEHQQWLAQQKAADEAIAKLQASLDGSLGKLPRAPQSK